MTYQLMQSDLEFAAFLDRASRQAERIRRKESRPRSHQERVMLRYLIDHQPATSSECRCKDGKAA